MDTSSIEVIQPHEGLEVKLPISPPQQARPNSPESPWTNIAVPLPDDLLTKDEGTGDDNVPTHGTTIMPDVKVGKKLYLLHHRFHKLYGQL